MGVDKLIENSYALQEAAGNINKQIDKTELSRGEGPIGWRSKYAELQHDEEMEKTDKTFRDPLTGLYNRRMFKAILDAEVKATGRGRESKEIIKQAPLTLVLLDLDKFKEYNDKYGHPKGDAALKEVTVLLGKHFRDADIKARLGGDEFGVVMPRARATEATFAVERFRRALKTTFRGEMTVSIGLSDFADFMNTKEDLIEITDRFLYKAKEAGGNTIWHPLRDAAVGLKEQIG